MLLDDFRYRAGSDGVAAFANREPQALFKGHRRAQRRRRVGLHLAGVRVFGGGGTIGALVARHRIAVILIAIPSATGAEMTRILELCHNAEVEFKTVPGLGEVMEARSLAGQIREVALEDLLGRTPVHLEEDSIRSTLQGKIVLVTGAAGSIGFELCRQIARFHPAGKAARPDTAPASAPYPRRFARR